MTRKKSLMAFIKKTLLPVAVAAILFFIFKSACTKDGITDYFMLWLLCGLPFGIHRMFLWIIPGGRSFGGSIAVLALNILLGAVIGGIVLIWRLVVAAWYVPLTVYRLLFQNHKNEIYM